LANQPIFSKKSKGAARAAPIAAHYRDGGLPVKNEDWAVFRASLSDQR
jgi:hypothetical protein